MKTHSVTAHTCSSRFRLRASETFPIATRSSARTRHRSDAVIGIGNDHFSCIRPITTLPIDGYRIDRGNVTALRIFALVTCRCCKHCKSKYESDEQAESLSHVTPPGTTVGTRISVTFELSNHPSVTGARPFIPQELLQLLQTRRYPLPNPTTHCM